MDTCKTCGVSLVDSASVPRAPDNKCWDCHKMLADMAAKHKREASQNRITAALARIDAHQEQFAESLGNEARVSVLKQGGIDEDAKVSVEVSHDPPGSDEHTWNTLAGALNEARRRELEERDNDYPSTGTTDDIPAHRPVDREREEQEAAQIAADLIMLRNRTERVIRLLEIEELTWKLAVLKGEVQNIAWANGYIAGLRIAHQFITSEPNSGLEG